ncbi:MAG: hypothetical protein RLZZ427_867 [Pseudomonadota bacterium]|jgi:hypothetical protein
MDQDLPPLIADPASARADDPSARSLADEVRQLADEARTLIDAELAYQKARVQVLGTAVRGIAAWGALAAALLFFALMALVIGALLALAPMIGGLAATGVVLGTLMIAAALSVKIAARHWRRVTALLAKPDPPA